MYVIIVFKSLSLCAKVNTLFSPSGMPSPAGCVFCLCEFLITSAEEGGYVFGSVCLSVCLFVCLSVGLLANL